MMDQLHAFVKPMIAKSNLIRVLWSTFLALVSVLATLPLLLQYTPTIHISVPPHAFVLCIIYSVSQAHFNAAIPKHMNYIVWIAFGNRYTYSARGFFSYIGVIMSTCYIAHLWTCTPWQVSNTKKMTSTYTDISDIKPFLYAVPVGWSLVFLIVFLILQGINEGEEGNCFSSTHNLQHCKGYIEREIWEDFTIPCNRGASVGFKFYSLYVPYFMMQIVSGMLLGSGISYFHVKKAKQSMLRYNTWFVGNCHKSQSPISRKVMGRAVMFTIAHLITFGEFSWQTTNIKDFVYLCWTVSLLVGTGYGRGLAGNRRAAWPETLKWLIIANSYVHSTSTPKLLQPNCLFATNIMCHGSKQWGWPFLRISMKQRKQFHWTFKKIWFQRFENTQVIRL